MATYTAKINEEGTKNVYIYNSNGIITGMFCIREIEINEAMWNYVYYWNIWTNTAIDLLRDIINYFLTESRVMIAVPCRYTKTEAEDVTSIMNYYNFKIIPCPIEKNKSLFCRSLIDKKSLESLYSVEFI